MNVSKLVHWLINIPTEEEIYRISKKYGYDREQSFKVLNEYQKMVVHFDVKQPIDEWIHAINEGFKRHIGDKGIGNYSKPIVNG